MIKRAFDLILVIGTACFWLPLLLLLVLLVKRKMGSPAFFRQKRPGKNGVIFDLLKFRTMTDKCDSSGELLPDDQRVTAFGKWLRSTSLDELPELLNVLKGEMSLVGPRPLLVRYLDRYTPEQKRRHEVRPGLTGWAQVNGRNAVTWDERFQMDVWYVENQSIFLDMKILTLTLKTVLYRSGIDADGRVGMEEFMGVEAAKSVEKR